MSDVTNLKEMVLFSKITDYTESRSDTKSDFCRIYNYFFGELGTRCTCMYDNDYIYSLSTYSPIPLWDSNHQTCTFKPCRRPPQQVFPFIPDGTSSRRLRAARGVLSLTRSFGLAV